MSDEVIGVQLRGDSSSFVDSFNKASTAAGNFGKAISFAKGASQSYLSSETEKLKKVALGTGAALAGIGLKIRNGLKDFSQFQTNMKNVATVADSTTMSMGKMSDAVRKLAVSGRVSQDVDQLSEGLYNIVSSGFQGADAMNVLTESAKAASAGLTTTLTAGTAVSQILNAYGLSAKSAANVSDILFHTVNVGVLTFEELANTTGQWAAATAALHVPVGEATAALAAMTKAGADADMAATSLKTMMLAFINPSDAMTKALTKLGYASGAQLIQQMGLVKGLQAVIATTNGSIPAVQDLFQDVQGLNGVLQLTGSQAGFFAQQAGVMSSATGVAGETSKALAIQQTSLSASWAKFTNQVTEMRIELGALVAPLAKAAVGFGTTLFSAINSLPSPIREIVSGMSLLGPAMAVIGGAWAIHAAKAFLLGKAITSIATSLKGISALGRVPGAFRAIDSISSWAQKGTFRTILGGIQSIIANSDTLRQALFRIGAQAAITGLAIGGTVLVIKNFIDSVNDARDGAKKFADSLGGIGFEGLDTVDKLTDRISKLRMAARDLGDAGRPSLGESLIGAAQLATPFTDNSVYNDELKVDELNKKMNELGRIRGLIANISGGKLDDDKTLKNMQEAAKEGKVDLDALLDTWTRLQKLMIDTPNQANFTDDQRAQYKALIGDLSEAKTAIAGVGAAQEEVTKVAQSATAAEQDLADAMLKFSDASSTAKDKADAYGNVMSALIDKATGVRDAQATVGKGLRDFVQMTSDLKEAGKSLDNDLFNPFTEKGAAMQDTLSQISKAMGDWATQIFNQTGNAAQANDSLVSLAGGFVQVAQEAGFSADQIETMLTLMGLTPETVQSLVSVPGADQAIAQLLTVNSTLSSLNGKTADAYVVVHVQAAGPPNPITGELPQATVRAAGPPNPITGEFPVQTTGNIKSPADQIKEFMAQIQDALKGGIGDATKGFKPKTSGGGGGGSQPTAQKITPEEAASYAYQAGFRGQDLIDIVAIAGRESGYNPKAYNPNAATGDLSYGLTQVNMIGSLGPSRRAKLGIADNEELFDPLTNMKAAFQLFQESGNQLTPWGGYKGQSNTYGTDRAVAEQAVANFLANSNKYMPQGETNNIIDEVLQKAKPELTGIAATAVAKYKSEDFERNSVLSNMVGGYSRVGAGIIADAIQSGQDPTDQFNAVADSYMELTQRVGKDTAVQMLYWADNADAYKQMADRIIKTQDAQRAKEDYLFSHGSMSGADYRAALEERIKYAEQYSDVWMQIQDQIAATYATERQFAQAKMTLGDISMTDYIAMLNDQLSKLTRGSKEYMDVWNELHDLQSKQHSFMTDIANAVQDSYKAITDPIKDATSLISAFGGQLEVTGENITGFFEHMKEGTKRWIDAIAQLKQEGLDPAFLQQLMQQGPQSLGLATGLLSMGQSGIDFVNQSMADINNMTGTFGQQYMSAPQIGTNYDNSMNVTIQSMSLDVPPELGLTRPQVVDIINQAVTVALTNVKSGSRA